MHGQKFAFNQQWKVQVVATPGRKTKTNGPVAGSAFAPAAAANVQVRKKGCGLIAENNSHKFRILQDENDDLLDAQWFAWTREEKKYAIANMNNVRKLKRKAN